METAIETRERPILFSSEMVRAILDGRKTQTRRVIKYPPEGAMVMVGPHDAREKGGWWPYASHDGESITLNDGNERPLNCPYASMIGDVLYVKETFALCSAFDDRSPNELYAQYEAEKADVDELNATGANYTGRFTSEPDVLYRADGATRGSDIMAEFEFMRGRWRPSIHMPKWASRIRLRITDVRVERVQDISAEDAIAEGIIDDAPGEYWGVPLPVVAFSELWESVYGKRPGCSWVDNPWVWAVSFERA